MERNSSRGPVISKANLSATDANISRPTAWPSLVEEIRNGGTSTIGDDAVLAHVFETFGSSEKANHWLHRPNHVFQGRTPLEVIGSNPEAVEIELTRIDYGVYI
jgi:hypothetical protein